MSQVRATWPTPLDTSKSSHNLIFTITEPEDADFQGEGKEGESKTDRGSNVDASGHVRGASGGYILGSGAGPAGDELRQQLHAKWENEKKLQKK